VKSNRKFLSVTVVAVTTVVLAACGLSSGSNSPNRSTSLSANTQKAIDGAYKGDFGMPPQTSPKPQAGRNIWVVTLGAQIVDYQAQGQIVDAAKLMGWHVTVFDGKFSPDTVVSGLRQAIAAKADGIVVAFADCATVKAGLQDVKAAHIPVVGIEAIDCDQQVGNNGVLQSSGQPGLFTAQPLYNTPSGGLTTFDGFEGDVYGPYQALGMVAGTKGHGEIIALNETDTPIVSVGIAGFRNALKGYCPACKIVDTINFVGTDLGPTLQQKVAQALAQHPEANAVYAPYDAPTQDVSAAVIGSGRTNSLFVMGGEGTAPVADLIRENRGVNAGVGYSVTWEAWSALDALNRLFHGEKPVGTPDGAGFPSGMGTQLYDSHHNMPSKGQRFQGPIDFQAAYRKAWGVSGG
jgi:ribose transport system substrate-binding protein